MHKKQLLLAHRGYSGIAPENTHLAFEMAYQYDFDGVEFDVHLTKDNHLVIIHDENTKRTALTDKVIAKSTLKELKKDDHSAFFTLKTLKQEIMTFEEFLDLYLDKFRFINAEIKTDNYDYPGIEDAIDKLAEKYGTKFYSKIVFSSFNFSTLERMYEKNNNYKLAFLWWKKREFEKINSKKIKKICSYLNPWTVLYDKFKDSYKELKIPFLLWTIRSKSSFEKYKKDKDVYAQISNYKF